MFVLSRVAWVRGVFVPQVSGGDRAVTPFGGRHPFCGVDGKGLFMRGWFWIVGAVLVAAPLRAMGADDLRLSPDLSELLTLGEHGRTYRMMMIIFQVAVLLAGAKLLGWLCERIKVPGVIGELLAGAI